MNRYFLTFFVAVFSFSAFGERGRGQDYSVGDRELDHLERGIGDVEAAARKIENDFANRGSIPDPQVRANFERQVRDLRDMLSGGRNSLANWPDRVRRGGGGGGGGAPQFESMQIQGFFAVGKADSKDRAEATRSHADACNQVDAFLKGLVENRYDLFECGGTTNISQFANIGYSQLTSQPILTIKVPKASSVRSIPTVTISGSVDSKDAGPAWDSWFKTCMDTLKQEKQKYGNRFIAGSCGAVKNISRFANINYKQYESTGTVYIE